MISSRTLAAVAALALATPLAAQVTNDPFPEPIGDGWAPLVVGYIEFARVPGVGGGPPLMTNIVDEPGTQRMFVNDMNGPISSASYDGRRVTRYVDTNDPRWGYPIQTQGSERGL
ncbi:MAG TPA: hypothetical protein VM198_01050, partial [Longimicrobiales bacterium]|nr:hypothetical protein [Longimicrobiales bacterium]